MPEILKYLMGYVYIEIDGFFPERFLNVCAANRIKLWDYDKKGKKIYAKISIKDYLKIRPIKRRCAVKLKIISRNGLQVKTKPYKKRYGIIVGAFIYIAIICLLTNFVWNIEVCGNKKISKETIIKNCREIGVFEGAFKGRINEEEARHKLILKNNDISWASVIIEGSHLTVNISETLKVEKEDKSPSNLISTSDGVIEKIEIKRGMPTVRINQAVQKGELLATGVVQYTDGTTNFVNSSGKVIAKTKKEHTVTISNYIQKKHYENTVESRQFLTFFGINVPLSLRPVNYLADKKVTQAKISCGTSYIPIYLNEIYYKKYQIKKIKLTDKECVLMAKKSLKEYEKNTLRDVEIINFDDKIKYNKNSVSITRRYLCKENIAKSEKIKINTVN